MQAARTTGCNHKLRFLIGLTLIEVLVVVATVSILVSLAIGGWQDYFQLRRLQGHADVYRMHFQWARSASVARNQPVVVQVKHLGDAGGCYLFYLGPPNACSCTAANAECVAGGELLASVGISSDEGIQVKNPGSSASVRIDPKSGTLSPTLSVVFSDTKGREIRLISALTGRTRACGVNLPTTLPNC